MSSRIARMAGISPTTTPTPSPATGNALLRDNWPVDITLNSSLNIDPIKGEKVKLKVPAGSQSGKTLRIPGKGAPRLKGSGNGDLKVKIKVVVPHHINDEQRTALEAFSAADAEKLRAHIT